MQSIAAQQTLETWRLTGQGYGYSMFKRAAFISVHATSPINYVTPKVFSY